jgi:hypothetical protein
MNTITKTLNSHCGQFATRLTAQFAEGTNELVALLALKSIQTDVCDSAICKHFGVGKGTKKKPGVYVKREDVPYEGNVAKAAEAVQDKIIELVDGTGEDESNPEWAELNLTFSVTGQWVKGEDASPMKRATRLVEMMSKEPAIKSAYKQIFTLQGMKDFDGATFDQLVKFAHEKGHGVS